MGKKKPFIDRSEAAHFHLVHRSQRDPKIADPEAPQRVLQPIERRGGASERASQSTRAWLEEQDLGGFEAPDAAPDAAGAAGEDNSDLGMPHDGYNYGQHLRAMAGDGTFVSAPPSVVSQARSHSSQLSKLSQKSRTQGFVLRGMPGEAFETEEELAIGVGGAYNDMNVVQEEEDGAYLEDEMEPDLWAALHDEEDDDGEFGEIDEDFILQAGRETELVMDPVQLKKSKRPTEGEGEEREGRGAGETSAQGASAAARKAGGLAALMGWSDDEDDDNGDGGVGSDDDDDNDDDELPRRQEGGSTVSAADKRKQRLLDEQFAHLMDEYEDDEIGELDEFDPAVRGGAARPHSNVPHSNVPHFLLPTHILHTATYI